MGMYSAVQSCKVLMARMEREEIENRANEEKNNYCQTLFKILVIKEIRNAIILHVFLFCFDINVSTIDRLNNIRLKQMKRHEHCNSRQKELKDTTEILIIGDLILFPIVIDREINEKDHYVEKLK